MVLPIESGRIEGYIFRMAPEGCAVHGKIVDYRPDMVGPALFVRCVEEGERISRAAAVDSSGAFKIEDVQPNSECILEVVDPKGTVIARTLPFSTRDKKETVAGNTNPSPSRQKGGTRRDVERIRLQERQTLRDAPSRIDADTVFD